MHGQLDAIQTSNQITSSYRRYLGSLLTARDPRFAGALSAAIESSPMLDKGPYLEATPPYAPGATLRELITEGVLSDRFAALASPALPLDRPLYRHQEAAIRKARAGRNVVVATGTGSGKTESFLIPILDSLVRERVRGTHDPGVRALLLYPMNALANDQMKRLRSLLAGHPDITFGRYTGETEQDPVRARERFEDLNPGEPRLPNELLSRQEMQATPPHLLLTNYAMLEYMLLRPQDMTIFAEDGSSTWRFLVIDESHVYDGTQGAEIAMLVRRLRDRVAPTRSLQCLTTSATVGSEPRPVTTFASNLFGVPFEWVDGVPSRQDLVTATRTDPFTGPGWGPLTAAEYLDLARDADAAVVRAARARGYSADDGATALAHEDRLRYVRSILAEGPQTFTTLAQRVFGDDPDAGRALAAMVDVASALRTADGVPPLSARYHLFLRATEGAFTCLSDSGPHVRLARHVHCDSCGHAVFEVGSCKRCGALHVVGSLDTTGGVMSLVPRTSQTASVWLALAGEAGVVDEDEQAVEQGEEGDVGSDEATLCPRCGAIGQASVAGCPNPDCGYASPRRVRRLTRRGTELAGCVVCGARGAGTVRAFETGADAAGAVIATALYQQLPSGRGDHDQELPGEGRKLLLFSDSRQAAAFFAPYLNDTYGQLQRRRLITLGLERGGAADEGLGYDDVVFATSRAASNVGMFSYRMTAQEKKREVAPWVMAEAVGVDDRQSLEGLGLVRIALARDPRWRAPQPLRALGFTEVEAWDFVAELVRSVRQQGAVTMPESEVPADHQIFAPRLGPIWVRLEGPERVRRVLSWLPGRGTNGRVDYVSRVLEVLGVTQDPRELLQGVWRFLTHSEVEWLRTSTPKGLGTVHQVDHELLRFELVTDRSPVFRCTTCLRVAPVSVRGVCPAIGCGGRLERFTPPEVEADTDHYRAIYRGMRPVPLTAQEHTAQWQATEAARIQQQFVAGQVNALSCSTTFELGVDVGELQAVMLRNVPPSTANYLQRAGRAGRRAGSAALVVTYAQRRSHDLTQYAAPEAMMTGEIRAPYVPLENERIDRRHAHSVALSAFFRWHLATAGTISRSAADFFLAEDGGTPPVAAVSAFLSPVPDTVRTSLRRVLPPAVQDEIGVATDAWVPVLLGQLDDVRAEFVNDVAILKELGDAAAAERKFGQADRFERVATTIRRRDLLGYLGNRNIIPKYGFPVDTVELRTNFSDAKDGVGARLDLTRDLTQAIHEYAPGAEVVAGGRLWTSRGVYRLPGRELEEFAYRVCESCGLFREDRVAVDAACPDCGHVGTGSPRRFIVPEFGFVAARETRAPGKRPPQSSWSGATYVVRRSDEARERTLMLPGGFIRAAVGPRGRLVSIADGPGRRGFLVCESCGWATTASTGRVPREHTHLLRSTRECRGHLAWLDLAHHYETDLLTLDMRVTRPVVGEGPWKSVLYALLEAASETLQIARDDIGGTLSPGATWRSLELFDAVPGGGGNVLRIEEHLEAVLAAALRRVEDCECGPETSCYACLRGYRNQRDHDILSRGAAADILRALLHTGGIA